MLKQIKWGYHGNYAQYFEMGRVEWLRNIGILQMDGGKWYYASSSFLNINYKTSPL
jgi:acyl-CoA thioester hydrolase